MGRGAETMYNQTTFIFSNEQHETILSMHFTKFCKSENTKNKKLILLMKIISTVPKVLFFKTTNLYTVYLFSEYADS